MPRKKQSAAARSRGALNDRAGKADRPLNIAARETAQAARLTWSDSMISVSDGRSTLGFLMASRGRRWQAMDADLRSLGEFPSREEARAAITRR